MIRDNMIVLADNLIVRLIDFERAREFIDTINSR